MLGHPDTGSYSQELGHHLMLQASQQDLSWARCDFSVLELRPSLLRRPRAPQLFALPILSYQGLDDADEHQQQVALIVYASCRDVLQVPLWPVPVGKSS